MRRTPPILLVLIAALLAATSHAVVRRSQLADLETTQELPADVQVEVDETWQRYNEVFGAHRRCFDDVSLVLVGELDGGDARYVVDEARIEIEIPTSPRRFRDSLAHELAHHLEHTCGSFAGLRRDFAALDGVPDRSWSTGPTWQQTPAELWAETVVQMVTGERVRFGRTMPLPPGARALVAEWAGSS